MVLHQTAFSGWVADNPMWAKVRAHYVVRQDGSVLLHAPTVRMRYGFGVCNAHGVTVEHEGNYPSGAGRWWKPDRFGRDHLADHPEQVRASRDLLRMLVGEYPTLTRVVAHRHISKLKANCPGPDIWREVGVSPLASGSPLPDTWRGEARMWSLPAVRPRELVYSVTPPTGA